MKKDYKLWEPIKRSVHNVRPRVFFAEREIWSSYLGENIGYEQDGKGASFLRPLLILRKFNNEVCWAVPLTNSLKEGHYYFNFKLREQRSRAIISQVRPVDAKRFKYKIGTISKDEFENLKMKVRQLIA